MERIYFDNASTSFPKAEGVAEAVYHHIKDFLSVCEYSAKLKSTLMKYGMVNNKINIDNFIVMMMDNEMRFGAD